MQMKIYLQFGLILLMVISFCSCNKATPAGFWVNFKPSLLTKSIGDQGPYGGHRAIDWKTRTENTFTASEILQYATLNGWQLVDSMECLPNDVKDWFYLSEPIFPLSSSGFSSKPPANASFRYFPRWLVADFKIYGFKTGWVAIEPGSGKLLEENGFVLLNKIGTEMSVYHLWGE